ncbi:hypothetical protein ABZ639_27015 [Saccharomonospora sp. NPDC006951]
MATPDDGLSPWPEGSDEDLDTKTANYEHNSTWRHLSGDGGER